jgi:hypothetical protein
MEKDRLADERGGEGVGERAKSFDSGKAWTSINHSNSLMHFLKR